MWDDAASVDMKIGFDPVIADYEVGLDTIAECSFCHKIAIVTKDLQYIPPSPSEHHYVLFPYLFYVVKTWHWIPDLNIPKGQAQGHRFNCTTATVNSVLCEFKKYI